MEKTPTPRTPSNDEVSDLLAEQSGSGLTMAAFARERGLTTWKLYTAARRKAGVKKRGKSIAAGGFAPVSVIGSVSPGYELDLGREGVLKIPAGFDAAELLQLLEVLRAC